SRSLLGVKRTWLVAAHMSAFDPKRTLLDQTSLSGVLQSDKLQLASSHAFSGMFACTGEISSKLLLAQQLLGLLPRVRNRRTACGALAPSWPWPRTIPKNRPAARHSCKGCRKRVGSLAATCRSIIAGARGMPTAVADTRRNWLRSPRTSSLALAP